jgi:hypothetical protein
LLQAERIESDASNKPANGRVSGRVKWKLWFHWTPGGEDLLPDGQTLIKPWWVPSENGKDRAMPKYMDRNDLQNDCHNLLPLDMFAEPGPHTSSSPFSRGWYCINCGKLNKQIYLRHRMCSSTSCQVTPILLASYCYADMTTRKSNAAKASSAIGYAVRLEFAREHSQALPSVAPGNLVPKTVPTNGSAWADGMHTCCYAINDMVEIKHVFTSNRPNLQEEANILFREIQLHVELRRQVKGPGILILP